MKLNRLTIILFLIFFIVNCCYAQQKKTFLFAEKDTSKLYLDVYKPDIQNDKRAALIFVFGGGFIGGARDDAQIKDVVTHFTSNGYVVIGIDYRLGLKGVTDFSIITGLKNYERAVRIAAEDLISALSYTLENFCDKSEYNINPENILAMGSSAGAITVLQTDYAICNNLYNANILPDSFHLAGVISYSGAIFSTSGSPKYKNYAPAPTFFCHGTEDKLVIYNKTQFCNLGLFGSSHLAKKFKKSDFGYYIRRYTGLGHQVAGIYLSEFHIIDKFINEIVFGNKKIQIDETYYNPAIKAVGLKVKVKDLKKFS